VSRLSESVAVDAQEPTLCLERWRPDQVGVLLELSRASFPELHEWMPWAAEEFTQDGQQEFLQISQATWESGDGADYAVIAAGRPVGTWGLFRWEDEPDGWGIGYWLTRSVWRRGYATRATLALARLAFEEIHASRVVLDIDRANTRSEAVAGRAGFRLVEVLSGPPSAPGESGEHSRWELRREDWLLLEATG
jgi:ribosomal-protein-serine acetyltransferase